MWDGEKRRISLGLKQVMNNPWEAFASENPVGSVIEGEIKNITEFGLFVGLNADLDGMVHLSDIAWDAQGEEALARYNKGDIVKAKVLDVDPEKERISSASSRSATIRSPDRIPQGPTRHRASARSLERRHRSWPWRRQCAQGLHPQIRSLARAVGATSRAFRRRRSPGCADHGVRQEFPQGVSVGEGVEMADDKEAIAKFGSSDSGASLGDILGAALREKNKE